MRLWGRKEETLDPEAIRARTKAELVRLGGNVMDGLRRLGPMTARSAEALAGRTLVLDALANLAREAPVPAIKAWIVANGLTQELSTFEAALLQKETEALTGQERIDARWYDEAIYALLWAGGLVPSLPLDENYPASMLSILPNVERDESGRDLQRRVRVRPEAELIAMLDLYYCAHLVREGRKPQRLRHGPLRHGAHHGAAQVAGVAARPVVRLGRRRDEHLRGSLRSYGPRFDLARGHRLPEGSGVESPALEVFGALLRAQAQNRPSHMEGDHRFR